MKLTVPSIGRIVHYTLAGSGTHRPAIVTETRPDGALDLYLFYAPADTGSEGRMLLSVRPGNASGTWHWPEREPKVEIDIPDETEKEDDP